MFVLQIIFLFFVICNSQQDEKNYFDFLTSNDENINKEYQQKLINKENKEEQQHKYLIQLIRTYPIVLNQVTTEYYYNEIEEIIKENYFQLCLANRVNTSYIENQNLSQFVNQIMNIYPVDNLTQEFAHLILLKNQTVEDLEKYQLSLSLQNQSIITNTFRLIEFIKNYEIQNENNPKKYEILLKDNFKFNSKVIFPESYYFDKNIDTVTNEELEFIVNSQEPGNWIQFNLNDGSIKEFLINPKEEISPEQKLQLLTLMNNKIIIKVKKTSLDLKGHQFLIKKIVSVVSSDPFITILQTSYAVLRNEKNIETSISMQDFKLKWKESHPQIEYEQIDLKIKAEITYIFEAVRKVLKQREGNIQIFEVEALIDRNYNPYISQIGSYQSIMKSEFLSKTKDLEVFLQTGVFLFNNLQNLHALALHEEFLQIKCIINDFECEILINEARKYNFFKDLKLLSDPWLKTILSLRNQTYQQFIFDFQNFEHQFKKLEYQKLLNKKQVPSSNDKNKKYTGVQKFNIKSVFASMTKEQQNLVIENEPYLFLRNASKLIYIKKTFLKKYLKDSPKYKNYKKPMKIFITATLEKIEKLRKFNSQSKRIFDQFTQSDVLYDNRRLRLRLEQFDLRQIDYKFKTDSILPPIYKVIPKTEDNIEFYRRTVSYMKEKNFSGLWVQKYNTTNKYFDFGDRIFKDLSNEEKKWLLRDCQESNKKYFLQKSLDIPLLFKGRQFVVKTQIYVVSSLPFIALFTNQFVTTIQFNLTKLEDRPVFDKKIQESSENIEIQENQLNQQHSEDNNNQTLSQIDDIKKDNNQKISDIQNDINNNLNSTQTNPSIVNSQNQNVNNTSEQIEEVVQKPQNINIIKHYTIDQFEEEFQNNYPNRNLSRIYEKMKAQATYVLQATKDRLQEKGGKQVFEFEFMIDSKFNTFLVQINKQPEDFSKIKVKNEILTQYKQVYYNFIDTSLMIFDNIADIKILGQNENFLCMFFNQRGHKCHILLNSAAGYDYLKHFQINDDFQQLEFHTSQTIDIKTKKQLLKLKTKINKMFISQSQKNKENLDQNDDEDNNNNNQNQQKIDL